MKEKLRALEEGVTSRSWRKLLAKFAPHPPRDEQNPPGVGSNPRTYLRWGAGGFELDDGAALTLEGLEISGPVVAAPGSSLELMHVTFVSGGCMRGEATLVDTPRPEPCLFNVIFDGADADAFLASLGSGLPGTYVLRLAGEAQTFEVWRKDIHTLQPGSLSFD